MPVYSDRVSATPQNGAQTLNSRGQRANENETPALALFSVIATNFPQAHYVNTLNLTNLGYVTDVPQVAVRRVESVRGGSVRHLQTGTIWPFFGSESRVKTLQQLSVSQEQMSDAEY